MKIFNKKQNLFVLLSIMIPCMFFLSGCSVIDNTLTQANTTTQTTNDTKSKDDPKFIAASTSSTTPNPLQNLEDTTIVYYIYGSNVFYLDKDDNALKGSKNIKSITLYDALSRGMKLDDININITVYYQNASNVYYLKQDDNRLKDSKDIKSTTLFDALSRGMKLAD